MEKRFIDLVNFRFSDPQSFKEAVTKDVWTIHYWKSGRELLTGLTAKARGAILDSKLDVVYAPGACAFRSDGKFYYDPDYLIRTPYFEPTQRVVIDSKKMYVYIFHELVHYFHYLEHSFKATLQEELRTVGLYETANEQFSENKFRRELNLPRRPCYCWQRNARNAFDYDAELQKRRLLKLPDQALVGPQSPECRF
jgi:hypothetical protein